MLRLLRVPAAGDRATATSPVNLRPGAFPEAVTGRSGSSGAVPRPRRRPSTLRAKLLAFPLVVVIPTLAVVAYTAVRWRQHELAENQSYAVEMADHAARVYTHAVETARDMLVTAAPLVRDLPATRGALDAFVDALRYGSPYVDFGVLDENGRVVVAARPADSPATAVPSELFQRAAAAGNITGQIQPESASGSATLTLAYAVSSSASGGRQVVFTVTRLSWLAGFGGSSILPAGSVTTIFDSAGTVIAQSPNAGPWVGRSARGQGVVDAAIGRSGGTISSDSFDGVQRMFAFQPLLATPGLRELYVSIGVPRAGAAAPADVVLRRATGAVAISILFALLAVSVGTTLLVVRPVQAIVDTAQELNHGRMDARVPAVDRPAEFEQLAQAFNAMAAAVQAREEELARLERRFRALIENSVEGIALRDARGTFLYLSPATATILGYEPETLVGRSWMEFVHPEDLSERAACMQEVLASPGKVVSTSFRLRHRDGQYRWIAAQVRNLLDDPSVRAIVSNYHDISAWRDAQEALRRGRDELEARVQERTAELQKLSRIIEQTADSVFVTDRQGVIEYVNPAFEELTGYSRQEALGATPRLFASGLHDQKFYQQLWHTILAGRIFRAIVKNKAKNGRVFDEEQTITPIRDGQGLITHFVSTGRDVTNRKRMQEAMLRLNAMLEEETTRIATLLHDEAGQFLTAAHITLADVARELDRPLQVRLDEVRGQLDRVEDQLRTLSHDLHPRILQDLGLVGTLRFRAQAFARRTGLSVVVEAGDDCNCNWATQVIIYRVVQEALTNAGKHARARRVTVTLLRNNGRIQCSIRDDGAGFDVAGVFEREGEPSLGLRNMQDRVEAAGGTFLLVSSPGRGTEITAFLPLEN